MHYLGIDLGGTNVAAAVVDREGTILGKVSLPTPRAGAEAVADQMAAAARAAAEKAGVPLEQVESVGIGSPGYHRAGAGTDQVLVQPEFCGRAPGRVDGGAPAQENLSGE